MIRFRMLFATLFALLPTFAFATNHTPGDQWGHFTFHFNQMLYWLGQGQWSMAFYQADCTQDAVSKLLFVHGGALSIALALMLFIAWTVRKKIAQLIHQATWFTRFRRFA